MAMGKKQAKAASWGQGQKASVQEFFSRRIRRQERQIGKKETNQARRECER